MCLFVKVAGHFDGVTTEKSHRSNYIICRL